jgi:hypothetical protein
MKRFVLRPVALLAFAVVAGACSGGGFPEIGLGKRLKVTITEGDVGSPSAKLPISVVDSTSFTLSIEADLPDGTVDTTFNGYVNLLVQPGTISNLDVRNVQLQSGLVTGVVVPVVASFGETHIWADDLG